MKSSNGIQTHDLCDTCAVLYQLNYETNWELVTSGVCNIRVEGERWKIIYLNCEERYEIMIYHRSYVYILESCEINLLRPKGFPFDK